MAINPNDYVQSAGVQNWHLKYNSFIQSCASLANSIESAQTSVNNNLLDLFDTTEMTWCKVPVDPTYISSTSFSVPGDQSDYFPEPGTQVMARLAAGNLVVSNLVSYTQATGVVVVNDAVLTDPIISVYTLITQPGTVGSTSAAIIAAKYGSPGGATWDLVATDIGLLDRTMILGPGNWGRPSTDPLDNIHIVAERGAIIDPGATDLNLNAVTGGNGCQIYQPSGAGKIKFNSGYNQVVDARDFGLHQSASAATNATALQLAFDAAYEGRTDTYYSTQGFRPYPCVLLPPGEFDIGSQIDMYNMSRIKGAGMWATVLNFTSATSGLYYNAALETPRGKRVIIQDLHLCGSETALNGIEIYDCVNVQLINVMADFFTKNGFLLEGGVSPLIFSCRAEDNLECGLRLNGSSLEAPNAFTIIGGAFRQNAVGIFIEKSLRGGRIDGMPIIESNIKSFVEGSITYTGLGIHHDQDVYNVSGACYFENNYESLSFGERSATPGLVLRPINCDYSNSIFAQRYTSSPGYDVNIITGKNIKLNNITKYSTDANGVIKLGKFADAPILQAVQGFASDITAPGYKLNTWLVKDASDNYVSYNSENPQNILTTAKVTGGAPWYLDNATASLSTDYRNPVNRAPVYKITQTASGIHHIKYLSSRSGFTFDDGMYTIGCWLKSTQPYAEYYWYITTSTGPVEYTSIYVDTFAAGKDWRWVSISRHIVPGDAGNIGIALRCITDVSGGAGGDSFYVSDWQVMRGIIESPPTGSPVYISLTSDTTPNPDVGTQGYPGYYALTALAGNASFGTPAGNPVDGQELVLTIKDDGTARTLSFSSDYAATSVSLPTTTVAGKYLWCKFRYSYNAAKWHIMESILEP